MSEEKKSIIEEEGVVEGVNDSTRETNEVEEENVEEVLKNETKQDTIQEEQEVVHLDNMSSPLDEELYPNIETTVDPEEPTDEAKAEEENINNQEEVKWSYKDQKPYEPQKNDDLLDKYYKNAINALREFDVQPFGEFYMDSCNAGVNRFYLKNITETKFFDEEWIKTLESFLPSIDKIIRNPKYTIRYDEEIVAVEKAKKIDAQSVRHLASHSELIKEVRDDGFVMPKKILTKFAEEEIATYENRFIMTLINRLYYFVRVRHEIIEQNVLSYQNDHMFYVSNFPLKDEEIELKLDIRVKRDLDNPSINQHNQNLLQRVDHLMLLVNGYRNSQFMRELKNAKKVYPPIMKTNVILKNADFRNAYTLWLFLDRYSSLGFDIAVRERPVRLSRSFKANIDRISALIYAGVINNKKRRQEDFTQIDLVEPIQKKSTRIAKTNVTDIIKRPDSIQLEGNLINEYYLELNKKLMKSRLKEYYDANLTEASAIRKVCKETIDITNGVFDSFFNLEENVGYFEKYTIDQDPDQAYKDAKNKVKYAKALKDLKLADLKKSFKLEKSLYMTMKKANNAKIRSIQEAKKKPELVDFMDKMEKEYQAKLKERRRLLDLIKKLDAKQEEIIALDEALTNEIEELKQLQDEEDAAFKAEYKQTLHDELTSAKKAYQDAYKEEMKKMEELQAAKAHYEEVVKKLHEK